MAGLFPAPVALSPKWHELHGLEDEFHHSYPRDQPQKAQPLLPLACPCARP